MLQCKNMHHKTIMHSYLLNPIICFTLHYLHIFDKILPVNNNVKYLVVLCYISLQNIFYR